MTFFCHEMLKAIWIKVELTGLSANSSGPGLKKPPWMLGTKLKAARRRAATK